MTDSKYRTLYVTQSYHDALNIYRAKHGGTIMTHTEKAIVKYLTDLGMARRWDGSQWIWYEVEQINSGGDA